MMSIQAANSCTTASKTGSCNSTRLFPQRALALRLCEAAEFKLPLVARPSFLFQTPSLPAPSAPLRGRRCRARRCPPGRGALGEGEEKEEGKEEKGDEDAAEAQVSRRPPPPPPRKRGRGRGRREE